MEKFLEFFEKIQIQNYTEEMTKSFYPGVILVGVLTAALFIFAAFAAKKGHVICFFAGVATVISQLMTPKYIEVFHTMEFVKYVTGSSQNDVNDQLADYYMSLLPSYFMMGIFSICTTLALVFTIILCVKIMKSTPKVFGVFALILVIVKFVAVSPIPMVQFVLGNGATVEAQAAGLAVYNVVTLLPALLLAVAGLIRLVSRKKS